jgi:F0F1-type ATP synthase delta subunit
MNQKITITSAAQFPEETKSSLEQKLSAKYPNSGFEYKVDSRLIAGFQVNIGDTELHFDLQSEINYISSELV